MATIKDVAMDAGVSVGTVSNVINGGNVSEERRQRVEQSIQKLGYQVNGIARKMRTQRTDYVVVILPAIHFRSGCVQKRMSTRTVPASRKT